MSSRQQAGITYPLIVHIGQHSSHELNQEYQQQEEEILWTRNVKGINTGELLAANSSYSRSRRPDIKLPSTATALHLSLLTQMAMLHEMRQAESNLTGCRIRFPPGIFHRALHTAWKHHNWIQKDILAKKKKTELRFKYCHYHRVNLCLYSSGELGIQTPALRS